MCTHGEWHLHDQRKLLTSLTPCSELGMLILALEIQSLPLWRLGSCSRVIPIVLRFITSNYCLHQVCILISTFLQFSCYCKACHFLLNCQQFWNKFQWDAFHVPIFHQNELYQTKWKPQLVKELCNCYSPVIQHGKMHFSIIIWFHLIEDLPENSSLWTEVCPSFELQNHSLTCV